MEAMAPQRRNSAWRPLLARSAPLTVTLRHSFLKLQSEFGGNIQIMTSFDIKTKKFSVSPKIFTHLKRAIFQLYFGRPFCRPPLPKLRAGSAPGFVQVSRSLPGRFLFCQVTDLASFHHRGNHWGRMYRDLVQTSSPRTSLIPRLIRANLNSYSKRC